MKQRAKTKLKAWAASFIPFAVLGVIAWKPPSWLRFEGAPGIGVRVALLLIGVALALASYFFVRGRTKQEPEIEGGAEIDETMAAAAARLASAELATDARLSRLPLALVLGPTGSTKTSITTHSGLDPELLAGEVMRGETVIATDPLNVWYAHGTLLVEAGGRMLEDPARWRRFVRHLEPRRLAAALGRGRQAPRVAILCFACDDFVKPGASQNLHTLARLLRARLQEASQQLGIRLPVYVLFTRADRLPFFGDYVRSLTNDEAEQVLGTTLPLSTDVSASWAEAESRRLHAAFDRIVRALSLRRIDLLPRENQEALRASAYEFPRELRKIVDPAVQLLVDIFRPSQLGVNPLLRGFYFTGVRPIIIRDVVGDVAQQARPAVTPGAAATSVFNAAMMQQALHAPPPSSGAGRKVPQWVFLPRFFRDVVLGDEVALNITGHGTRVDLLRRGLIGAAAALCLFLAGAFTVSYNRNADLIEGASAAAMHAQNARTASAEDLTRLDSLRRVTAWAAGVDRGIDPRYRWGLSRVRPVHSHLRNFYFERFQQALWTDTRSNIIAHLQGLPATPGAGSNFERTQRAFLVYRVTTDHPDRSTMEEVTQPLLENWRPDRPQDGLSPLAEAQFAYFADELRHGKPFPNDVKDDALVAKAQHFLLNFGGEAYYSALISDLNRSNEAVAFEGSDHVISRRTVPGAFTQAGTNEFQEKIDNVQTIFSRYDWLYDGRSPTDLPNRDELERRYQQQYIATWHAFLADARISDFGGWAGASARLSALAADRSPLFNLIRLVSHNTQGVIGGDSIALAFQPVRNLVDPQAQPATVTSKVPAYTQALQIMADEAGAAARGEQPQRLALVQLRGAVTQIVPPATSQIEAPAVSLLSGLLVQPARLFESVADNAPRAGANEAGARFCSDYRGIAGKLPFNRNATTSASAADVDKVFGAGGSLEALYQGHLAERLTETGQPKGPGTADSFRRFYAEAVRYRNVLYPAPDRMPARVNMMIGFDLPTGVSAVRLLIDTQERLYEASQRRESDSYAWQAEAGQRARLTAVLPTGEVTIAEAVGNYAVFKLFHAGRWSSGGGFDIEWTVPGTDQKIFGRVRTSPSLRPLFEQNTLSVLNSCQSRIAN